ncbi:hypothetical protein QB94_19470 [Salmonella enterica subsp. enterica serovar Newport]|nr:hypothetical protein [Salmonella enterica subsp. enterica serovar Newport]
MNDHKPLFDPAVMSRDDIVREIKLLRGSRDLVADIVFEYPEVNNRTVRSVVVTDEDVGRLKAALPEHHFRWLKDNDADVITAGKLDDFFTVADEFSLLAEDLDPELEEELEESVIIPQARG